MLFPEIDWAGTPLGPQKDWPPALAAVYRLMMHSRQPMFLAWGRELTFIYNAPYGTILGPRHPGAFAQPFEQVWADIWADIKPLVDSALAGQSVWRENMHLVMSRHGYPEDTWYTFSYSPLHDDDGRIAGMFCSVIETTGQVLAERALRENEGRFRALLDAAPAMVWVTDRNGDCTHLNQSWYAFTGQTPATGLGHGWLDAVHPADRPAAERKFEEAVRAKSALRLDYRLRHTDGTWRYAIDAARPRLDENGNYLGHVGSVLDITDRRQAEERQTLLAREVDHRAKNVLAVVQAMIRMTRAEDVDGYAEVLQGRVAALARAHTLLAADSWMAADLGALLAGELTAFLGEDREERVTLVGPTVALPPGAAQPLTMIVHELATNAFKHGALSVQAGRLEVRWSLQDGFLRLDWTEHDGPPLDGAPRRLGFGTRVLDGTVRRQLGGRLQLDWRAEGLACQLEVPLAPKVAEPAEQRGLIWGSA